MFKTNVTSIKKKKKKKTMTEARHKRPHTVRFHLYEMSKTGKFIETESRSVVVGG